MNRKELLKYGLIGGMSLAIGGPVFYGLGKKESKGGFMSTSKTNAADDILELWKKRGWLVEAKHYEKRENEKVECILCPNTCLLPPGNRGICGNRINIDGKLYTMVYGNPCVFHVDPIEKKPLMHFLPSSSVFSLSTSGCCLKCLNCQNWEISQSVPEDTKRADGDELRMTADLLAKTHSLSRDEMARLSFFPQDVVASTQHFGCPSIAYTYGEPIVYYEYVYDTAKLAKERGIKNVWVTCGNITKEALKDLCPYLDGASVNLKSFDAGIYRKLNSGWLEAVLDTLLMLKEHGVWMEVINLVVPTYTDNLEMIRKMCGWLVEHLGPEYPLHFSKFHPAYKLMNLPPTPTDFLLEAREVARQEGLHYVYLGNVRDVESAEQTFCPGCGKLVIDRDGYSVKQVGIQDGKCEFCGYKISGVWKV